MAARKQKQMNAQVVEDEDCQLRDEIVAGTGVAKESAVVCVRMPPAAGRKHRTSHLQAVPATVPAITELAAELTAAGFAQVSVLGVEGNDFALENLTVQNTTPYKGSQAEAVYVNAAPPLSDRLAARGLRCVRWR